MRKKLRLLPLPFCIALSLSAQAADDVPEDWGLCPIEDAVPAFPAHLAPQEGLNIGADPTQQATDIDGDSLDGTEGEVVNLSGNVFLRRGEQVLSTDRLSFDQEKQTYTADGNVHYQDRGMRLIAARAKGDQNKDTHELEDIKYQLVRRRGNGGAERITMKGSLGSLYGST